MDIEKAGFYLLVIGVVLLLVGWIALVTAAFRTRWYWGTSSLLLPPVALLFIARHFRRAAPSLAVIGLGILVGALPYGFNFYERHFAGLGPREKQVDGELHITLTGWDQSDYSLLRQRPGVVVLQMANGDVDDRVLDNLQGMEHLRELDLNDAPITDAGLAMLAGLPRLEELRLARTKITDEGFRQYLAGKESLKKLDLTGTAVKGKTKRDWKKARQGREYLD
jgi:Leucine Rich repeat